MEETKEITETEMRSIIIDRCRRRSSADVARELGISRSYMSQITKGQCHVSAEIAQKLGYAVRRDEVVRVRTFERMADIA